MYLLTMAIADVQAGTYQGSCGLRTIATSMPVRMAPLGTSHLPERSTQDRQVDERGGGDRAKQPGRDAAARRRSGAASATSSASRMMSRPFGVRKNRRTAERRAEPSRGMLLQ